MLECQLVRRLAEVQGEVLDGADVRLLGIGRHVADRHVANHALPQRGYALCHGALLSDGCTKVRPSQTGARHATALPCRRPSARVEKQILIGPTSSSVLRSGGCNASAT